MPPQELPASQMSRSEYDNKNLRTQKWYAWIHFQPGDPQTLHLTAEVESGNTGARALLFKRRACALEDTLCLELIIYQEKGDWPKIDCWLEVGYSEVILGPIYSSIHIFSNQLLIEKIPVDIIAT